MTPFRLLILAVLFYIGWRLIRKSFAKKPPDTIRQVEVPEPEDVLVEDPVCHVLLPKHQALRLRRDGITYYFCSDTCCDQFAGQPEQGEK